MSNKKLQGVAQTAASISILLVAAVPWPLLDCKAQEKPTPPEYDYYSLALSSISNSAREASKLPDIQQRVNLLLNAAKILAPAEQEEAKRLLDVALGDLKELTSEVNANVTGKIWYQRQMAAKLRIDVLALYAKLNPEKVVVLQKELQATSKSTMSNTSMTLPESDTWVTDFSIRRTTADRAAKIGLSLIEIDPEKAFAAVVGSLKEGAVSGVLIEIVEKLLRSGNREFLTRLELGIGEVLASSTTLDPSSFGSAGALFHTDKEMPMATRNAFVSFFMRSLRNLSSIVTAPNRHTRINTSYINAVFIMASLNARPIISQYAPDELMLFEQILETVAPLVPAETRSRLQGFQPETFSDLRERLNDILKDSVPARRDLRLVRLIADLLQKDSKNYQKNLELVEEAINGFSETDLKVAYTDRLTITRIEALMKQKKFIGAQQLADLIPSEETRAWALLSLSTVAVKADRVLGFELITNALKTLDKAPPSPHKVELALMATAMLAKDDPERAFDTLSAASRYANSSASRVDPPRKPPVAFGLEVAIGEAHTRLGVFPESLGGLKIDPSLLALATTDWFRADSIVDSVRDPLLRLRLKLQFAGAVLDRESKRKEKKAAQNQHP